jgi:hypothetical protein
MIPVVLFAYKRPDHLRRTIAGLKDNSVPLIYAFCDGPRQESDYEAVTEARQLIRDIDWCDVKRVERDTNLGLGVSVRSGVAEVFRHHDKLVVVEDDIVLLPGAYAFICRALEFYEKDSNVMSVSLWSHPALVPAKNSPVFFCPRFNCWGWGAYRRSWVGMERTAVDMLAECRAKKINVDAYGPISQAAAIEQTKNVWAIRFSLLHFLKGNVNVWSTTTYVENIGLDGTGENRCARSEKYQSTSEPPALQDLVFPHYAHVDARTAQFRRYYVGGLPARLRNRAARVVRNVLRTRGTP